MTVQSTTESLEVRRNAGLFGLIGLTAWVMAGAYAWRAVPAGLSAMWLVVAALAVVGGVFVNGWIDARSPVLVVDEQGFRFRDRRSWTGIPWGDVHRVVVHARKNALRDGQIEVVPVDGLPLVTAVGLSTVLSDEDVAETLSTLAKGRAPITVPADAPTEPEDTIVAREVADEPAPIVKAEPGPELKAEPGPELRPAPRIVSAASTARRAVRANLMRPGPGILGTSALKQDRHQDPRDPRGPRDLPEARELRGVRGRVDLVFDPLPVAEHRVALNAAPVEAWPSEAADNPVIGNEIQSTRIRMGITIDALADRTRIRPHVIESMEVDDFAPCGGDFYARGHIRSVARILGLDGDDLIATYDVTYAQAPIEARKVFEAELATGPRPSIRLTTGGPNWAALLGVVMVIAIIWGMGHLLTARGDVPATTPTQGATVSAPEPAVDPDALKGLGAPTSNVLVLKGRGEETRVVVRGDEGATVWKGTLTDGETTKLRVPGKATVIARDGGAVSASINGKSKGPLGADGKRAEVTLGKA